MFFNLLLLHLSQAMELLQTQGTGAFKKKYGPGYLHAYTNGGWYQAVLSATVTHSADKELAKRSLHLVTSVPTLPLGIGGDAGRTKALTVSSMECVLTAVDFANAKLTLYIAVLPFVHHRATPLNFNYVAALSHVVCHRRQHLLAILTVVQAVS
jgi:hypothetical protein